ELSADVLECLRVRAGEAEATFENVAEPWLEPAQRLFEFHGLETLGCGCFWLLPRLVLDQVGIKSVAVPDRRLKADGILDQLEQLLDATLRETALGRDL